MRSTTYLCLTAAQMDARNWPASARPHLTEPHGTFWYFSLVNPDDTTIHATLLNVRQAIWNGRWMYVDDVAAAG